MRQRGRRATRAAMSARCKSRAARNPEKKALSQQANTKKRLPKSAHVLFSAPILIARLHAHRIQQS